MTLYQNIKQHFSIPSAFTDWEDYRNTLTGYLIRQADSFSVPLSFSPGTSLSELHPSLLIVGAGACNDLDLRQLLPHFRDITLLDQDEPSLKQAIATYSLDGCPTVHTIHASLNGIEDRVYENLCTSLSDHIRYSTWTGAPISPEDFDQFAAGQLDSILHRKETFSIPLTANAFDYVWCVGVHSQIYSMFSYIYHVFRQNLQQMYPSFSHAFSGDYENLLRWENDRFIPEFNDALLSCARQRLFIGLEQARHSLNTSHPLSQSDSTPIEGACQAIADLHNRDLTHSGFELIWPFYPENQIAYQMSFWDISIS